MGNTEFGTVLLNLHILLRLLGALITFLDGPSGPLVTPKTRNRDDCDQDDDHATVIIFPPPRTALQTVMDTHPRWLLPLSFSSPSHTPLALRHPEECANGVLGQTRDPYRALLSLLNMALTW